MYDSLSKCTNIKTYSISVHRKPVANFLTTPSDGISEYDEVTFIKVPETNSESYSWYMNGSQTYGEKLTHTFDEAGVYPCALVVTNEWNCADTIVKPVNVSPVFKVFIPWAFTPGVADELNNRLTPVVAGIKLYTFWVYNRWGQLLHINNQTEYGWDGTFNGSPCKPDIYPWKLEVITNTGILNCYTGAVTLIRTDN